MKIFIIVIFGFFAVSQSLRKVFTILLLPRTRTIKLFVISSLSVPVVGFKPSISGFYVECSTSGLLLLASIVLGDIRKSFNFDLNLTIKLTFGILSIKQDYSCKLAQPYLLSFINRKQSRANELVPQHSTYRHSIQRH
jgi:hypothetical protein